MYEGSRLVDLSNLLARPFCHPLVFTLSNGKHIEVMSGHAISRSLLFIVTFPTMLHYDLQNEYSSQMRL